ncbi:hypothetical protein [Burkholderia pseudomultivorans]|nr:hypothetical protein [Burkholderia pseudomultivorans]
MTLVLRIDIVIAGFIDARWSGNSRFASGSRIFSPQEPKPA